MNDMTDLLNSVPPLPWVIIKDDKDSRIRIKAADGKTVVFSTRTDKVAELIVTAVNFVGIVNSTTEAD